MTSAQSRIIDPHKEGYDEWLRTELMRLSPQWWNRLHSVSRRLGLSTEEAQDAVQTAVQRLLEGERKLSSQIPVERYLIHTLRWVASDIVRSRRKWQSLEMSNTTVENAMVANPDVDARIQLGQALDALAPRERQVAELLAQGYVSAEVAARLNIDASTVRSTIRHVRRKLANTFD